jgi:hypothetical protein
MSEAATLATVLWWLQPNGFELAHRGFKSRRCGNCKDDLMQGYGHDFARWLCSHCLPGFDEHARKTQAKRLQAQRDIHAPPEEARQAFHAVAEEPEYDTSDPYESWED